MVAPERPASLSGMSDPSIVRFRALVEAGLAALEARREEVNDLNVFPVADGDTGDNMVLTLRAVLQELDRLSGASEGRTIDEIGRDEIVASVARAALLGARGNSGVILSQLIRGAAEELASRPGELVDPVLIGAALARAADQAYGSVREPAEGTILTVVREMAHRVASELAHTPDARLGADATASEQDQVIAAVIESALAAGEESVRRGPDLLPVLREAGVVDAGGYGLVVLLAGIVGALRGGDAPALPHQPAARVSHPQHASTTLPLLHQLRGQRHRARAAALHRGAGADRRLGPGGGRRDHAQGPRPHRRSRRRHRPVRRRRRGLASRRGRHARAGRGPRRAPGGCRAGDASAARWRSSTATG